MYPRMLWYHGKLLLNGKRFLLATTCMGLTQQFSQNIGLLIFALKRNVHFTLRFNSASVSVMNRAFLSFITELSVRSSNENKIILDTNQHGDNFRKINSSGLPFSIIHL